MVTAIVVQVVIILNIYAHVAKIATFYWFLVYVKTAGGRNGNFFTDVVFVQMFLTK
jgi:hypothetical protein